MKRRPYVSLEQYVPGARGTIAFVAAKPAGWKPRFRIGNHVRSIHNPDRIGVVVHQPGKRDWLYQVSFDSRGPGWGVLYTIDENELLPAEWLDR